MKVKVLSRNPSDYIRECKSDIHKIPRNIDPSLHPFEAAREYTRALNAAKLERVFAKPFVGSLDGHKDGVNCMAKFQKSLSLLLSGSCNGEVKLWNLPQRKCLRSYNAHRGFVRGLAVVPSGDTFISIGDDKQIKHWSCKKDTSYHLIHSILGKTMFQGIDHHWAENTYATCGEQVDIWQGERSEPVRSFKWGFDTVHSVKFNPIEINLLASTASDRSVVLYDTRQTTPLRKLLMKMRSNTVAWNPMEAFHFTVANEDSNLYTYDMRRLDFAVNVHKDHVAAVLDVDYSPTGEEFVTGSFDRTIRIFPRSRGHSREVYHTKRMQRVFCVKWSPDSEFILSGSDEMNVRIWKADASAKLGPLAPREKASLTYNKKLKERYKFHPQVLRILRHRHVPSAIYKSAREKRIMLHSRKTREENRRLHSAKEKVPFVPERKKQIVSVLE
ncbi:DDB1- and CUL4-associated factor 13-like [Xenia sp. Carnegie-2017]|uniref:DDB1- and CUL4-associated factor 13-like n=1 Tax=Xenia sp. Carnegie-2017 TaxID=2897299 RepID=UPI001F03B5B4|nr:DDB1- and CUL4-associated factor 13-like [Xenia sp. Carnegie-2017]